MAAAIGGRGRTAIGPAAVLSAAVLSAAVVAVATGNLASGTIPIGNVATGYGAEAKLPAQFAPSELISIAGTPDVLVLGTVPCGADFCAQLWRDGAGGHDLAHLTAPPGTRVVGAGSVVGTRRLRQC